MASNETQNIVLASTPAGNVVVDYDGGSATFSTGALYGAVQTALDTLFGPGNSVASGSSTSSGGTGKVVRVTATDAVGSVTVNGGAIHPGDLAATIQTALQGTGGVLGTATVTDASDPGVPAVGTTDISSTATATADGEDSAPYGPTYALGNTGSGRNSSDLWISPNEASSWWEATFPSAVTVSSVVIETNQGAGTITNFSIKGSNTGVFGGEEVTLYSNAAQSYTGTGAYSSVNTAQIMTATINIGSPGSYKYYRLETTNAGSVAYLQGISLLSANSAVSGYYDIHLPVSAANAILTLGGTDAAHWALSTETAYVAPVYSGTYVVAFQGTLADQAVDLMTSATPGVTISLITGGSGGDFGSKVPNYWTATGHGAIFDRGAASTNGFTIPFHVVANDDATASWVVALKGSTTGVFGGEETVICTFAAVTERGDQIFYSPAGATLPRYLRTYHTVTGGSSPNFAYAVAACGMTPNS